MTILQDFIDLADRDRIELAAADLEIALDNANWLSQRLREIARDRYSNNTGRKSEAADPLEEAADKNDDYVVSHLQAALDDANEALRHVDPDPEPDMPVVCETRRL